MSDDSETKRREHTLKFHENVGHASCVGSKPGEVLYLEKKESMVREETFESVMKSRNAKQDKHMIMIKQHHE